MGYCWPVHSDPEIERLEAELHRSRFEKWDVETLLADRHRAKIEALERPKSKGAARLQVAKEIAEELFMYIGMVATVVMLNLWVLTGSPFGITH